ncbi:hypothetical protein AK812_SmicGene35679 [Symbiodinium microadriaticum]|uniref:Uncharacterized protein n=1 Tax=Symbiodinium microadriaticum TaxID=2951 RepID=A0A1Q9CL24_SYMMI|nr:hypothetical protein AK812_SmicGene35679 [Symbiodinium microadriaticum]
MALMWRSTWYGSGVNQGKDDRQHRDWKSLRRTLMGALGLVDGGDLQSMKRTGLGTTVLSSALMEAIWQRGDHDYLMEAENFFVELDLLVDVDRCRSDELTAEAHALIRWMEAGLWEEFIDHLEGLVGESQQVGDARGQPTMSPEEREVWWQWAERFAPPRQQPRSRSRSPLRDQESDTSSLMDKGRGRPSPKREANPASRRPREDDDEREPGGGRGGRWRERARDDGRRRVLPRSRSERVAARMTGRASGSHEGGGRACTREVRHLTPRGDGRRSPAMSMGDATCFWLHTMGLRNGTATDDQRALDPSRHSGRVDAIMGVRPEDLVMVMAALMRTLAMLVVESSQLMMMRVQQQPSHEGDEEVEVTAEEEGDEEIWMQTDLSGPVKRQRTEEQLAEDEHQEKLHREAEQRLAENQQDAREAEELEQARQDEVLWEQHRAALYRAWEEWEVANFVPAPPRRLRAIVRLTQGSSSEQMVCSVPLSRGSPVELAVTLHEQVPTTAVPEPNRADQVEANHMAGYDRWRSGGLSDGQVEAQFGADMLAMFVAQRLVEEDLNEALQKNPQLAAAVETAKKEQQVAAPVADAAAQGLPSGAVPPAALPPSALPPSVVEAEADPKTEALQAKVGDLQATVQQLEAQLQKDYLKEAPPPPLQTLGLPPGVPTPSALAAAPAPAGVTLRLPFEPLPYDSPTDGCIPLEKKYHEQTHSKSLTPGQQNWAPLIQEAFAQLEVKRATRKVFGITTTLCWTDHANLTRAQSSDIGSDQK